MPNCCCVTGCNGNYKSGPKVSLFCFPKDEELKKNGLMPSQEKCLIYRRITELVFDS